MYRTYSSYNNMPVPARRKTESVKSEKRETAEEKKQEKPRENLPEELPDKECREPENKGLLENLKTDDIILIAVAFVLLTDGCDDKLLLAAIAYIFISDIL